MRKYIVLFVTVFLFLGCKNNQPQDEVLSQEDLESLDTTGTNDADEINFNGKFEGMVDGKDYKIEINDDTFNLDFGGENFSGKAYVNDDGNTLELEPKSSNLEYKYLGWLDNQQLLVLDKNGNFPQKDIFLNRK